MNKRQSFIAAKIYQSLLLAGTLFIIVNLVISPQRDGYHT